MMVKFIVLICFVLGLSACASPEGTAASIDEEGAAFVQDPASDDTVPAEWTVMIYMNAKNNLEPFAINNFREIAETGSSASVNYVVEMGRPDPKAEWDDRYGNWSGVRRFHVEKNQVPTENESVEYVGAYDEINMGAPETLASFIKWAKAAYPARNYALVIWNHGQGFRLRVGRNGTTQVVRMTPADAKADAGRAPSARPASYRSVSSDDDFSGSILYNVDVRNAVTDSFAPGELKLLGYDACSMAMIETAYEMRQLAPFMVASEELEPGPGWKYGRFVPALSARPTMTPVELGKAIVGAYKEGYGNSDTTTLSLVDMSKIDAAADRLSEVGAHFANSLPSAQDAVAEARQTVGSYKPVYTRTTVDAITALEALRTKFADDRSLKPKIDAAIAALEAAVLANYASTLRQDEWGSKGIAMFFPLDEIAFHQDPDSGGYRRDNNFKPISFVRDKRWSEFVAKYVGLQ